jgi:hypothetical protein
VPIITGIDQGHRLDDVEDPNIAPRRTFTGGSFESIKYLSCINIEHHERCTCGQLDLPLYGLYARSFLRQSVKRAMELVEGSSLSPLAIR